MTDDLPDFEGAQARALCLLQLRLPPGFVYHSAWHTLADVLPAVERLAALEGVTDGHDLLLLRTAALYHDVGFSVSLIDHEEHSAALAAAALPTFGYSARAVAQICDMIRVTRVFTPPATILEAILVDADLDVLGRDDFWTRNDDLRRETEALYGAITDAAWYAQQVRFMELHAYRTRAAQTLRDAGKRKNLREVRLRWLDIQESGVNERE